jgi:T5orf172 domain
MSAAEQSSGYLYILTNDDMPGLVKVGKTSADAEGRAQQLSGATGVPSPFKVFKQYAVTQCDAAERRAHLVLAKTAGRPNERREFFVGTPEAIANILDDVLAPFHGHVDAISPELIRCMMKVERGEFILAHREFECYLNSTEFTDMEFLLTPNLKRMFGSYLAACCFVMQKPVHLDHILNVRTKSDVMSHAIQFLASADADAATRIILFVRSLE